ncbi:hypothetical protein D3C87_1532690 [compost metagenome]
MNLAPLDTQIDPIDRDESAEFLGEAFCLQDCVIHVRCTSVVFIWSLPAVIATSPRRAEILIISSSFPMSCRRVCGRPYQNSMRVLHRFCSAERAIVGRPTIRAPQGGENPFDKQCVAAKPHLIVINAGCFVGWVERARAYTKTLIYSARNPSSSGGVLNKFSHGTAAV